MKLIVQIPCFNEAATLPATLADIPRQIPGIKQVEVLVIPPSTTKVKARNAEKWASAC